MTKCPYCNTIITRIVLETPDITDLVGNPLYKGVVYSCPNIMCSKLLGVQMDPVALKSSTAELVIQKLKN